MKKAVLLLVLFLTFSCSNDDSSSSNDSKNQNQEVYMKVFDLPFKMENGKFTYYGVGYGTTAYDRIETEVSETVYKFYQDRLQNKNDRWIGEVDHE